MGWGRSGRIPMSSKSRRAIAIWFAYAISGLLVTRWLHGFWGLYLIGFFVVMLWVFKHAGEDEERFSREMRQASERNADSSTGADGSATKAETGTGNSDITA